MAPAPAHPAAKPKPSASRRALWAAVVVLALAATWAWQHFDLGQVLTL